MERYSLAQYFNSNDVLGQRKTIFIRRLEDRISKKHFCRVSDVEDFFLSLSPHSGSYCVSCSSSLCECSMDSRRTLVSHDRANWSSRAPRLACRTRHAQMKSIDLRVRFELGCVSVSILLKWNTRCLWERERGILNILARSCRGCQCWKNICKSFYSGLFMQLGCFHSVLSLPRSLSLSLCVSLKGSFKREQNKCE